MITPPNRLALLNGSEVTQLVLFYRLGGFKDGPGDAKAIDHLAE